MMKPFFLSCDWGSSRVRLRLVETASCRVLADATSERGASRIAGDAGDPGRREQAFENALAELLSEVTVRAPYPLGGTPVVASGMVTSQHGWRSVPYASLPLHLRTPDLPLTRLDVRLGGSAHPLFLVPGLRSAKDVMRGEECELIGLAQTPGWVGDNAMVLLPGTHCKHVRVADNRAVDFVTYMTGELYDVLMHHSVLGRTARPAPDGGGSADLPAFRDGVRDARRVGLSAALFQVRARALLDEGFGAQDGGAYLDGLLIGDELAAAARDAHRPRLWLCAGARLTRAYRAAAEELGMADALHCLPPEECRTLAVRGHHALLERNQL